MQIRSLEIPDIKILRPPKFGDHRGYFSETYNKAVFQSLGIDLEFVQDNHSSSAAAGTIRGLHFQCPPFAQDKLVRVARGRILDIAVDIRIGSPTYGKYVAEELSATNWNQIFVPVGFAHGFMTLEPDTDVIYKVTKFYSPAHDFGIFWDDAEIAIAWPLRGDDVTLSDKDADLPLLRDCKSPFRY